MKAFGSRGKQTGLLFRDPKASTDINGNRSGHDQSYKGSSNKQTDFYTPLPLEHFIRLILELLLIQGPAVYLVPVIVPHAD